eukprot:EG_transcript_23
MGCGVSKSPHYSEDDIKNELLAKPNLRAGLKARRLLSGNLWQRCTDVEKEQIRQAILEDDEEDPVEKAQLLTALGFELETVGGIMVSQVDLESLNQDRGLVSRARVLREGRVWDQLSVEEKEAFLRELVESPDVKLQQKLSIFESFAFLPEHIKDLPDEYRERHKAMILASRDPWPKKATALLECNCWGLATEADRAAVQAGLLVDASLPRPEKMDLCRTLGLEVQDEDFAKADWKNLRTRLAALPIEEQVKEILASGQWEARDPAEKEMFANRVLAAPTSLAVKKELLDRLGMPEFLNLVQDMLESTEPIERRIETLLASGCWELCSQKEKDAVKSLILQDTTLTVGRKEHFFRVLGLPEADLPSEEKDMLKFEILAQDSPVEERLRFLMEANLWQHCLKEERERFKQEILLRSNMDNAKKRELFAKMGTEVADEELEYRLSFTTTQEEQKRQAVGIILQDTKLDLPRKAKLLHKFNVTRLTKREEERLLHLILLDSRNLPVKRELLTQFNMILNAEQRKKLKQAVLKNGEAPLDLKRAMLVDFRLGVLTPEEKDTFRHQILTSPTLSAEDKRLYLLEFGIIKDQEGLHTAQTEAELFGEEDGEGEGGEEAEDAGQGGFEYGEDPECRQRIKASFQMLKRDQLCRRWEREQRLAKEQAEKAAAGAADAKERPGEPNWAKWMPGHIEDDGDSSQRVLEVGSEAIAVKRVPISEHFYASEVGIRAEYMYCIRKTKHNTLCLVPDSEADEGEDKQDPSKPLEYWLSTGYREVVLHVSKRTHRIINERTRGPEDYVPSQRRGKGSLSDQQREGLVAAASTLLEDDEERYIIKGTGDLAGMLDYFTEYEYQTFLLPALQIDPSVTNFELKVDNIINIPVQPCHTYSKDASFTRFVLQLVNPPQYSMFIINTIVSEMKLDIYRNETADTFRDVLSLVNAVAALGMANPSSDQLRTEVGNLLFHRLMYTTSPKLLGKIRPLHDLLHKEFVQKVLTAAPKPRAVAAAAALDEELEEEIEALPMAAKYNSSSRKIFEKLLSATTKVTAVISRSNFNEILSYLRRTGHMSTSVRVESANLESVLQTVEELKEVVSLNFLFVRVVGALSITDLSRLVRHAEGGSVRLFIINSGNLIQQLQLGGNLDCVYIAEDIGETSTLTAAPYNEAMPVSKVINYLDVSEDVFLSLDLLSETKDVFGTTRQDWRASEEARLEALVAADAGPDPTRAKDDRAPPPPDHPYLVIRTTDFPAVVRFYTGVNVPGLNVSVQDAKRGHGIDFDQLKGPGATVLVVLNSDLLSTIEKTAMFERILLEESYLVLVTTRVNTDDLCYQPQQFKGLHSFQPKLIHVQADEEDITTQVADVLDRMEELWSPSDTLYIAITFRVLRLCFGAKISLQLLTETLVNAMRRRQPEDVQLLTQTVVKQAEGMVDPSIFDIYANNVQEFVATICAQTNADEIYEYSEKRDPDTPITVRDLARLCQSYVVHCLRYDYDVDLPFDEFIHHIPVCQFLSQRQRIRAWLVNVIGDVLYKESDIDVATQYTMLQVPDGNNTHTNYLLTYFVDVEWFRTHKSVPMYLKVNSTEFELEELIVQRAAEMEELSWEALRSKTFPKNLDFLMDLLSLYPYPLKVLCCVAERKLFVNLLQANNPRFRHALLNLARNMTNESVRQVLEANPGEGSLGPAALRNHLAVIRWCLFGCGAVRDVLEMDGAAGLEVTDEDIRRIILLRLPFSAIATQKKRRAHQDVGEGGTGEQKAPGAEEVRLTLDNVLQKIVTFDLDDFLFKEVVFQKHLLHAASPAILNLDARPEDEQAVRPIGSVVINFIIHPIICKGESASVFMNNAFVKLAQLLVDGTLLQTFEVKQDAGSPLGLAVNTHRQPFMTAGKAEYGDRWRVFLSAVPRLTELAFSTLVLKASQHRQAFFLVWLLEHSLAQKPQRDSFLRNVFCCVANQPSALMRYFFVELVFRSEKLRTVAVTLVRSAPSPNITPDSELNNALYCLSISDIVGQTKAEFDFQCISGCIPLANLPCLTPLMTAQLRDSADSPLALARKALRLFHRDGFHTLFRELLAVRERRAAEGRKFENSVLLLLAWTMHPYESLDSLDAEEARWLLDLVKMEEVDFHRQVRQNQGGVSPLALYFMLPCALSYADLEYFSTMFRNCEVERRAAIICQDGVMYPPYLLRYPRGVRLPEELLEELDGQLKGFAVNYDAILGMFRSYTVGPGTTLSIGEGSQVKVTFGSAAACSAGEIHVPSGDLPSAEAVAGNPILIDSVCLLTINSVQGSTMTCTAKKACMLNLGTQLVFPYENEKSLCKLKLNITSGVSPDTIQTNLEALVTTTVFKQFLCTCAGATLCVNCATCLIVQVVLWTWFQCLGASEGRVRNQWLGKSIEAIAARLKMDPEGYWRKMLPDKDKNFAGYSTNLPFPSVVNTRYIVPSSSLLFGNTEESKRKTANYFRSFYPNKSDFPFSGKAVTYDELADKCSEDLGVRTATTLSPPIEVTVVMHKKKNFEKKLIDLEPVINLLNPFVELLLQLLAYIPAEKDTSAHAQEVSKTYLTHIERMLQAFLRGLKRTLKSGDEQRALKEAVVYRSLFSLVGKPLKHANRLHALLYRTFAAAGLQRCGSSLKELRWLKWNRFVETDFEVTDPLENDDRNFMVYPQTDKTNKLSLTEVRDFTSAVPPLAGLVRAVGTPPPSAQRPGHTTDAPDGESGRRDVLIPRPTTPQPGSRPATPPPPTVRLPVAPPAAPPAAPGDSFEDLPPLATVDERVQGQFIDCRAILGVTWIDYCARVFVRPGCLYSLVQFDNGTLRFLAAGENPQRKYEIINTFANNMFAWKFIRAHEGVVLFTDGLVLSKSDSGMWHVYLNNAAHPIVPPKSADPERGKKEEEKEEEDGKEKKRLAPSAAPDFGKFCNNEKKSRQTRHGAQAVSQASANLPSSPTKQGKAIPIEYSEEMHTAVLRQFVSYSGRLPASALFTPLWVMVAALTQFKVRDKAMRLEVLEKLVKKMYAKLSGANVIELKKLPIAEVCQRLSKMADAVEVGREMALALGRMLKASAGTAVDQDDVKKAFEGPSPASAILHAFVSEEETYQDFITLFRPMEIKTFMQRVFLTGCPHPLFARTSAETSLAILRAVLLDNEQHKKDSCHRDGLAPQEMVRAFHGQPCTDLFFLQVDEVRDRKPYRSDTGQELGFILPVSVLSFDKKQGMLEAGEQGATKQWLVQFLVSALPESLKSHVLNKMRLGDAYIKSVCDYKVSDLNLTTMLYALASSDPVRKVADDLLRDIRDVYNAGTFLPYCLRVGARNEYGVHVVSEESQALEALQSRVTFVPQVHLQDDQSVSNLAPLYGKIVAPFFKYHTCFVYVTGLQNVHDRLLKWVAEFTKSVPWAFVYFEGVDTTWNLPENTDRIYFHSDVLNNDARTKVIASTHTHNHSLSKDSVTTALKELGAVYITDSNHQRQLVSQVHKVHEAGPRRWVCLCDPDAAKRLLDAESLRLGATDLCFSSNLITYTAKCHPLNQPFMEKVQCEASSIKQEERTRHWTDWIKRAEDVWNMDWKLIHGSPGIGKTYKFDEEIIPTLKTYPQVNTAIIDGSSDKLVKFSLLDILSDVPKPQPLPSQSPAKRQGRSPKKGDKRGQQAMDGAEAREPITLVVLDEYHMMPDAQKRQLIHWYARAARANGGRVKLVMIANRIDINDRDLIEGAIKELETER